jgi:chaperonin cofactor prefoldin
MTDHEKLITQLTREIDWLVKEVKFLNKKVTQIDKDVDVLEDQILQPSYQKSKIKVD